MGLKPGLVSILLFLFLPICCLPALCDDAWMFRGNPEHSGVYQAAAQRRWESLCGQVEAANAELGGECFDIRGCARFYKALQK